MNNSRLLVQKSINISIVTTLIMSIFGIGFGLFIQSDAVMLDGFFNVINCIMAAASLWVTNIIQKPENKSFNFGYAGFVPLLNLCKGLLVFGVSVFALSSALMSLFHGGVPAKTGIAVIYAIIASTVCLIVAIIQKNLATQSDSPIVKVDAKNWLINGMISVAVGISFAFATFLGKTPLAWLVPYADPTIVIILVLIAIPIPLQIITTNLKQLMLGSVNPVIETKIHDLVKEIISQYPYLKYSLRMTEVGQSLYVNFHWLLPPNCQNLPIAETDEIRQNVINTLSQEFPNITIDIIFTQDQNWFTKMNEDRGFIPTENSGLINKNN